ncbi:hypothetical protein [Novacetimonas hansenii]|uniref:hypothetical protein n=1 Tax=Novacetimonas hansenii TaxID=436 RepID=UPI00248E90AE|nr:hypothetical protein [Novacetimonas hansenii]
MTKLALSLWWFMAWCCGVCGHKRVFENNPLIKNKKSFWVLPFFRQGGVFRSFLGKASPKTFIISGCYRA